MTKSSLSYQLAGEIFDTFRGKNDLISDDERAESGVVIRSGDTSNTEGIVTWGELEDAKVSQRLSLGKRGLYYFTTTFHEYGGRVDRNHIGPNSPDELMTVLARSLFVDSFKRIIENRKNLSQEEL